MLNNSQLSVTIVIPVKNAGAIFHDVCNGIVGQQFDGEFEVLCIDSGSTDGSQDIAERYGFRVIEIPASEFGHGKTRNFGAAQSNSKYIIFLTHDAVPANEKWLSELVRPLEEDHKVAGAFSKHIAHDNADPFVASELEMHFKGLSAFPVCQIVDRDEYDANVELRQIYHYFSDNSSCLRRVVWEKHPLPEVQFAEDQIWAKTIIEAGYKKAFAESSVVKHSHSFGPWETLQRSFDESRALYRLFGYRLCENWYTFGKSSIYLIRRDLFKAITNRWVLRYPLKTLSRIAESIARPLGHFLGWQSNLPKFIETRISREDWIRKL